MAISQTMSNPNHYYMLQSYQNDFSQTPATAAARNSHLSPEHGRVAKPVRRRSRASRRTPTTLLNTDTTNFKAMVQHFTGGPAAAPASGFQLQNPNQLQPQHVFPVDHMHDGGGPAEAATGNGGYGNFMFGYEDRR